MIDSVQTATTHLLRRLTEVRNRMHKEVPALENPNTPFGETLDSMAMVEFLAVLAEDYGVTTGTIEECVGRRLGTVAELATSLHAAGWRLGRSCPTPSPAPGSAAAGKVLSASCWLAATAARLPQAIQSTDSMNEALGRPAGWLERHAGIEQRRAWADEDPLAAAAEAGWACLQQAGWKADDVEALLVTAEAPPVVMGLAASLHHRLRLGASAVALDIGGACTGFLTALWTAQAILPQRQRILVLAVEAPTRYLRLQPGPAGENAALFGDAAAAALLSAEAPVREGVALSPVLLGVDGSGAGLLQVELAANAVEFRMRRIELASRAIEAMALSVRDLASRHSVELADLAGVVAHGGNGRLPGLLARKLGLPPERVWSETSKTGNLGSASLPVAWALHQPRPQGLVIWTAVGAGFMWGAVMVGEQNKAGRDLPAACF